MISSDLTPYSVPQLRELCQSHKLKTHSNRPDLVQRLEAERKHAAAWEVAKANPPECPVGYRLILDEKVEVSIKFEPYPIEDSRLMFLQAFYTIPLPYSHHSHPYQERSSGSTVESIVDNVRRNIGANYPVTEFLRPGQKSRAELEAEIATLSALVARNS